MMLGFVQDALWVVALMLIVALGSFPSSSAFQAAVIPSVRQLQRPSSSSTSLVLRLASSQSSAASAAAAVQKESSTAPETTAPSAGRTITRTIQSLDSLADFLNYIDTAPHNALAVVEFYGVNCPMCKRVSLKYQKIAKEYSKYGVLFAEMEHPANKRIMDVLNIRKFPFLHVYRNGQCVAAHGTESSSTFEAIVTDTIQRELDMSEQDWEGFLSAFGRHIQLGTDKINQLRQELSIMSLEEEHAQEHVQQ